MGHDTDGSVIGYCALQCQGEVANLSLPEWMRHKLQTGEAYLEQIGVSEKARGKGVGKKLMRWAEDTARSLGAQFISLEVMSTNPAKALYEREGYVVVPSPDGEDCCSLFVGCCVIWWCMGCRYYRTLYMVKRLA